METPITGYVHGHSPDEHTRLQDQAATLAALLHHDTAYPDGSRVLEVGCGVGAQTLVLAARSPGAMFTSIDIDGASVDEARRRATAAGLRNVRFEQADLRALPFGTQAFDHVFVCFVLEHLSRPAEALAGLRALLRPGGTLTVIEGDHGPTVFHPDSAAARDAIACQVELQRRAGGDACIGRALHPLLVEAGYDDVRVRPRAVYADGSRPELADGFVRRTFTAMIAGVRAAALGASLIDAERFDDGLRALARTAEPGGSFLYVFFKATARAPAPR